MSRELVKDPQDLPIRAICKGDGYLVTIGITFSQLQRLSALSAYACALLYMRCIYYSDCDDLSRIKKVG